MKHNTLAAALEYAELGYRVLPLKPGTKVPDLRHWPEEATTDPGAIRRHFALAARRGGGDPNVGIVTGSGLAVVDIDTYHGGEIPAWLDTDTAAVRTASGGLHYYYSVAGFVPNSVGRLAPGVDVRGERGQVAAPPSIILPNHAVTHADRLTMTGASLRGTGYYKWLNDKPIKRIDYDLLVPEDQKRDFTGLRRTFEYRDEVPVGERNNYLTSLAGYLFAQGESYSEVLSQLRTEVESLSFSPRDGEVESIVRSISRYH
jgi:hypothetical protein